MCVAAKAPLSDWVERGSNALAGGGWAMMQAARRRALPVVSGKLGRNSFCSFAAVSEVDLIITDEHSDPDFVRELAAAGPEVVVAPS